MLMRTTLLAFALAPLFATAASAAELPKQITIATEGAYPPWNFTKPDGSVGGYEIDLVDALCKKMQIECKVIAQDWDGIIPGLTAGKYDAIVASMGVTEERKKVVAFSIPYARSPNGFLTLGNGGLAKLSGTGSSFSFAKSEADAIHAIDELKTALKGKIIGVQSGSTAANFTDTYFKDLKPVEYPSFEQLGLELTAGRIDVAVANVTAFKAVIDANPPGTLVLTGPTFSGGVLGLGTANAAFRPADQDLRTAFDAAIDAVNKDGTNKALTEKWFGTDISIHDLGKIDGSAPGRSRQSTGLTAR
jgi:octopine/nopaline transport system substrate-binding protein